MPDLTLYKPAGLTVEVIDRDPLPPPPPPPPVAGLGAPVVKLVNTAKAICAPGYFNAGQAYDRHQYVQELTGPGTMKVNTHNGAVFGAALSLTLTFDGNAVATVTTSPTANNATFTITQAAFDALADGNYLTSVTGAAGWDVLDYTVRVNKGGTPSMMYAVIASYALVHPFNNNITQSPVVHQSVKVPAQFAPTEKPIAPRACPDFAELPFRHLVACTQLVIGRTDDDYRPCRTVSGTLTTANRQKYNYFDMDAEFPMYPLLDGPRGRANLFSPTSLHLGRNDKVYFTDNWRFGVVEADGRIRTLAGYRSPEPAAYWQGPQNHALVGDWSAVPAARRGFWNLWGMAWDERTLTTDPAAPPIGGEQPHVTGPVAFLADTLKNRVCKVEFSPTDRAAPAKITEFITGLGNPWNVIFENGRLHVSERTGNRISTWDATTGAFISAFATPGPEGMCLQDGVLTYGALATKSIRKRDLATGADALHVDLTKVKDKQYIISLVNGNSRFINVSISDGTFGPRGMLALAMWTNLYYGLPNMLAPDGSMHNWLWAPNRDTLPGQSWPGNDGNPAFGYPTAVVVGKGRMIYGASNEGLLQFSKALPTDMQTPTPAYLAGLRQWYDRGYQISHGHYGMGLYGLPLPWGVTPEIDAFLTAHGH